MNKYIQLHTLYEYKRVVNILVDKQRRFRIDAVELNYIFRLK